VIGDSESVINCLKGYPPLNTSLLDECMIRVMERIRIFRVISFNHIHRELNSKDDKISKMRVDLQLAQIHYEEYLQGEVLCNVPHLYTKKKFPTGINIT